MASNKGRILETRTEQIGRFTRTFWRTDFMAATHPLPPFPLAMQKEFAACASLENYTRIGFTLEASPEGCLAVKDEGEKQPDRDAFAVVPHTCTYTVGRIAQIAPFYPQKTAFQVDITLHTDQSSKSNQDFHLDGQIADRFLYVPYGLPFYMAPLTANSQIANRLLEEGDTSHFVELASGYMVHFRGGDQKKSDQKLIHAGRAGVRGVVTIDPIVPTP